MPVFTVIRTDSLYGCFRQCQRCNKKIRSHPGSDGTEPCEDEECVGAESKLAFCLKATVCSIGPSSQRRSVIVLFDKQSQVTPVMTLLPTLRSFDSLRSHHRLPFAPALTFSDWEHERALLQAGTDGMSSLGV